MKETPDFKVKKFFTTAVLEAIGLVNKALKESTNKYQNDMVLIIAGGEAYNYYIDDPVRYKTHDFDLKLAYLTPYSRKSFEQNPTLKQELRKAQVAVSDNLLIFLEKKCRDEIFNKLSNAGVELFYNEDQQSYLLADNVKPNNNRYTFPFRPYDSNKMDNKDPILRSISYRYISNEIIYTEGLIDVVRYYIWQDHYGDPMIDEQGKQYTNETRYDYMNRKVYGGFPSRLGFAQEFMGLHIARDYRNPNVYYISLGYLIWDSVRMVNWAFDQYSDLLEKEKSDSKFDAQTKIEMSKLEKYTRKYLGVIEALTHPKVYLKCGPFKDYCEYCSRE